jgi:hypothetical protein
LFASTALRNASRIGLRRCPTTALQQLRHKSSGSGGIPTPLLIQWYNIFGKTTIGYATWMVAGIIVAEGMTGWFGDAVWNSVNKGRTFETVDWTKFASGDEEEEEEEEESEEEEGDGEDDADDDDDDDE